MIPDAEVAELIRQLRDGEIAPSLVVLDRDLRGLDAELLGFVEESYEPTGVGPVWRRRALWIDAEPREGLLDVGSGPTDVLVGHGFYPPTTEAGRSFRRSRGRDSALRLPLESPEHSRLVVHARLEYTAAPTQLTLRVNEREAGRLWLRAGWQDYAFTVPPGTLRPGLNRVRLVYSRVPRDDPGSAGRNAVIALSQLRLEK